MKSRTKQWLAVCVLVLFVSCTAVPCVWASPGAAATDTIGAVVDPATTTNDIAKAITITDSLRLHFSQQDARRLLLTVYAHRNFQHPGYSDVKKKLQEIILPGVSVYPYEGTGRDMHISAAVSEIPVEADVSQGTILYRPSGVMMMEAGRVPDDLITVYPMEYEPVIVIRGRYEQKEVVVTAYETEAVIAWLQRGVLQIDECHYFVSKSYPKKSMKISKMNSVITHTVVGLSDQLVFANSFGCGMKSLANDDSETFLWGEETGRQADVHEDDYRPVTEVSVHDAIEKLLSEYIGQDRHASIDREHVERLYHALSQDPYFHEIVTMIENGDQWELIKRLWSDPDDDRKREYAVSQYGQIMRNLLPFLLAPCVLRQVISHTDADPAGFMDAVSYYYGACAATRTMDTFDTDYYRRFASFFIEQLKDKGLVSAQAADFAQEATRAFADTGDRAHHDTAQIIGSFYDTYTPLPFRMITSLCSLHDYAQNIVSNMTIRAKNLAYYMDQGFVYFVLGIFYAKDDIFAHDSMCRWDVKKIARFSFETGRAAVPIMQYAEASAENKQMMYGDGQDDFDRKGSVFHEIIALTKEAGNGAFDLWQNGMPNFLPHINDRRDVAYKENGTRINALVRIARATQGKTWYDDYVFEKVGALRETVIDQQGGIEAFVPFAEALGRDFTECFRFMALLKNAGKEEFFDDTHALDPDYPGSFSSRMELIKTVAGEQSGTIFKYALPALLKHMNKKEDISGPAVMYCIELAQKLDWRAEETFQILLPAVAGFIKESSDLNPLVYPSIGSQMSVIAKHLIAESKSPEHEDDSAYGWQGQDADALDRFCKTLEFISPLPEKYGLEWVVRIVREYQNPTEVLRDVVSAIQPFVHDAHDLDATDKTALLTKAIGVYDSIGSRLFNSIFENSCPLEKSADDFDITREGSIAYYVLKAKEGIHNEKLLETLFGSFSEVITSKEDLQLSDPASFVSGIRALHAVPFRNERLVQSLAVIFRSWKVKPDLFSFADALRHWVDYEDALQALVRADIHPDNMSADQVNMLIYDIIKSRTSSYIVAVTTMKELDSTYRRSATYIGNFIANRAVDLDVRMRVLTAYNEIMQELNSIAGRNKAKTGVEKDVQELIITVLEELRQRIEEIAALPPERLTRARKIASQISRARDVIRKGFIACYLERPLTSKDEVLVENELVRENILRVTALVTSLQRGDTYGSDDTGDVAVAKSIFTAYIKKLFETFDEKKDNGIREALDASNAWLRDLSRAELEKLMKNEDVSRDEYTVGTFDNKTIVQTLCDAGYERRLFTEGISLTVPVFAKDKLTEDDIKEQIRSAAYELVEIALEQGMHVVGKTALTFAFVKNLDSFEAAKKFIAYCEQNGNFSKSTIQRMQAIRETIKAYASQKVAEHVTKTRFQALIKKDFFAEARAGAGVPGCYDPDGGWYRKMPYFHASEMNAGFIQIFSERGKQVANAVVVYTTQGAFVFPGYNASLFKMDTVFAEAIKELSRYVPRIYLKTSSAGFTTLQQYATKETCTLTKPAVLYRQQYFDAEGSVDESGQWRLGGSLWMVSEKILRAKKALQDRRITSDVALRADMPKIEWQELADHFLLPFVDETTLSAEQEEKRRAIMKQYPFLQNIQKYQGLFTLVGIVKKRISEEGRLTVDDDFYAWLMHEMAERLEVRDPEVFVDIVDLIVDFLEAQKWPLVIMTHPAPGRDEPVRVAKPVRESVAMTRQGRTERVFIEFTRPENAEGLAPELYELQKTEYEPAQWHSVDMFSESLENPDAVNMVMRNEKGDLIGFLIGRPFADAKHTEGLDDAFLEGCQESAAYYVDDNLIRPDYRGSFKLLTHSLKRYYAELHSHGYAVVFDHARVQYSVSKFYKRLGAECLAVYDNWDNMGEPFELLRLPLDFDAEQGERNVYQAA